MDIGVIILAAGASRRMGTNKLALPYRGKTILGTVVDAVMSVEGIRVVVVLGHHETETAGLIEGVHTVVNEDADRGMLSSIKSGLEFLGPTDAVLVVLGDQPTIEPSTIWTMIASWKASPFGIKVASHDGKRGHPVLLAGRYRQEILELHESFGLNEILRRHASDVNLIETGSGGVLKDVDTPEDYKRLDI